MKKLLFLLVIFALFLTANAFAQDPTVSVQLIPESDPVIVPAGGSFNYTGILTNNTDEPQITDVWIMLDVPDHGIFGPLDIYEDVHLAPNQTLSAEISQFVPCRAPLGVYTYWAFCGDYPNNPIDSSSFQFTVVEPNGGDADSWVVLGAFDENIDIDITPDEDPTIVPAGGSFGYTGTLTNQGDEDVTADLWMMLDVPDYGIYGPLSLIDVTIPADFTISRHVEQYVPTYAPLGTYTYMAFVGDYPDNPWDEADMEFTVIEPEGSTADSWGVVGWKEESSVIPSVAMLGNNYPNPFNAQTSISFDVPTAGNVSLDIYNIMGQKVATLVNGNVEAGSHTVVWDAGNYSSGIYFYKLNTGNKVFTKRMTLLK